MTLRHGTPKAQRSSTDQKRGLLNPLLLPSLLFLHLQSRRFPSSAAIIKLPSPPALVPPQHLILCLTPTPIARHWRQHLAWHPVHLKDQDTRSSTKRNPHARPWNPPTRPAKICLSRKQHTWWETPPKCLRPAAFTVGVAVHQALKDPPAWLSRGHPWDHGRPHFTKMLPWKS